MTTSRRKTVQEHISLARKFLADAEREFAAGEDLQGSEKLWGATSQSLMAVAKQRGWRSGKSNNRADVVERLADELQDTLLESEFAVAEKFRANSCHDFMEDPELARSRVIVNRFVNRILAMAENP